jgi:predicted HTH transcriptional regulator
LVVEPYETSSCEYKQSAPWDDIKYRIAKTALGMANLRDGGLIIVGVESDDTDRLTAPGMSAADLRTFRTDDVVEFIGSFAQTRMALRAEVMEYDERQFYVVEVDSFSTVPVIARKSSPKEAKGKIREGAIYYRPSGKAQTVEATAEDLQEIINHAVELELRRYLERGRRAGIEIRPAEDRYQRERGDL